MSGFGDLVQKAFYLGVGAASYAAEKAGSTIQELRGQAQKLADEMVQRGEMTTEEARKFVDEMIQQAQQQQQVKPSTESQDKEPRRIEIISEDEEPTPEEQENIDALRQQVESLQEQLRNLKRNS